MTSQLRREVRLRANQCCEYCGLHQDESPMSLHIEHILPKQHGGTTDSENLALACSNCNLHKGPNLTGIDPDTGLVCLLFHPRQQQWTDHFKKESARIVGVTETGRTTVWLFEMNSEEQMTLRAK